MKETNLLFDEIPETVAGMMLYQQFAKRRVAECKRDQKRFEKILEEIDRRLKLAQPVKAA